MLNLSAGHGSQQRIDMLVNGNHQTVRTGRVLQLNFLKRAKEGFVLIEPLARLETDLLGVVDTFDCYFFFR